MRAGFATLTQAEVDELALTSRLTHEVPEIRSKSLEEFNRTIRRMAEPWLSVPGGGRTTLLSGRSPARYSASS